VSILLEILVAILLFFMSALLALLFIGIAKDMFDK
jgi:hypothetical protein